MRRSAAESKLGFMSAAELIEKIKALPPAELAEVRNFLLNGAGSSEVKYASNEEFEAAAGRVFETHDELLRKLAQ